jgi:hypothetical protein
MTSEDLQSLCETGQQQLMEMDYLAAEATLVQAEQAALELSDFDTLSRLYMPLQEARRQRRQRCGEGIVHLHLIAQGPNDYAIDASHLIEQYPHGQLLIAGWGTIAPSAEFRKLRQERRLFVETYLAAAYPPSVPDDPRLVAIVPFEGVTMPEPIARSIEQLRSLLPPQAMIFLENQLLGPQRGDFETYARTMALWEQLHTPFLAAADAESDPLRKMDGYRKTITVDYACELAHQKLSAVARQFARTSVGKVLA